MPSRNPNLRPMPLKKMRTSRSSKTQQTVVPWCFSKKIGNRTSTCQNSDSGTDQPCTGHRGHCQNMANNKICRKQILNCPAMWKNLGNETQVISRNCGSFKQCPEKYTAVNTWDFIEQGTTCPRQQLKWTLTSPGDAKILIKKGYPLVNIQKTMENHHAQWVNPLFLWPFSIAIST
jgi:hypothetical protein